jgi:soluble lytic murein transglycosylase-like protein
MRTTLKAMVFVVAAYTAIGLRAAGPDPAASSVYRLNDGDTGQFRFVARDTQPSGVPEREEAAVPVSLAQMPFAAQIRKAAQRAAVDPTLVHALIYVESRYNPGARSPKGAIGLMQLMPETARRYGVTKAVHAPEANLRAGTHYLGDLLTLFDNRIDLALAAYNAGENAVLRHGMRIPPYRETRDYVPAVLARYRELKEAEPAPGRVSVTYLPGTRLDLESLRAVK